MIITDQELVLTHFGTKGMRWGFRKEEEETARVTAAKQKILEKGNELQKLNKEGSKNLSLLFNKEFRSKRIDAEFAYKFAKEDLKSQKILDKLNSKPKSKWQLSMEEKYKAKGLTDDEAAIAAYKNIRAKKIWAAVGGIALASVVAYGAYKLHKDRVDTIIKAGSKLQNVTNNSTNSVRDAFFASNNKLDNLKYQGQFGSYLSTSEPSVFKKDIKVLSDIKQASPHNAHRIFENLMKTDKDFATKVAEKISVRDKFFKEAISEDRLMKVKSSLAKGVYDRNMYEVFNTYLVDHSPKMQELTERYYKALAEKGYNAIRDVQDEKYSGYNAINPIIAFGTTGKVEVVDIAKMTNSEIAKKLGKAELVTLGESMVDFGSKAVGVSLALIGTERLVDNKLKEIEITNYKKEHPNTKLTRTEISRLLEIDTKKAEL